MAKTAPAVTVTRKGNVSQYRGRYHRTIGKVLDASGRVRPKKFLLGTDRAAAEMASRRLEQLWAEVITEHQESVEWTTTSGISDQLGESCLITGELSRRIRDLTHGPIWRTDSLMIAEAVRKGEREIAVHPPPPESGFTIIGKYVEQIGLLRQIFTVIAFVPSDPVRYARDVERSMRSAREEVDEATTRLHEFADMACTPAPAGSTGTLYQALDGYGEYARSRSGREFGLKEAEAARRIKDAHPDIGLADFGLPSLRRIADYWAARPPSKKTGRSIALSTVANQLKTARRFLRWLHCEDAFGWRKPEDAEEVLRVDIERLWTDDEIASLKDGVAVWTVDELATLYGLASDRERLLMLLGLNCGFAQAEICSLRRDEIDRDPDPVTIRRIRRKTRVYGEFALWPETVAATDWFLAQRRGLQPEKPEYLMVSARGKELNRQGIANAWNGLLGRVGKCHADFRRLSFKHLRKTAGHLVREAADGEIMGVFLCHGKAVVTDDLADRYSNRPFGKVAATLGRVRSLLQPMFDAATDAFSRPHDGSPNIPHAKIEAIRELSARGETPAAIARDVGVSERIVRRWAGSQRPG